MLQGSFRVLLACAVSLCAIGTAASAYAQNSTQFKLVLQITVDGLRGDLLDRYGDRFTAGGFRSLLERGVVFTNAHYSHANTETIVGHTTLATGAHPSEHGMVGNVIYDARNSRLAYSMEDADSPMLPTREVDKAGAQVDPAQKRSGSQGRSPVNILVSTISNELSVFYAGKPKVFGVSGKDRSAIAMAGHVGKAFWYSTNTGDFQTSAYYYNAYPDWVRKWNEKRQAEKLSGQAWKLRNERPEYIFGFMDNRPFEADLGGYGRTFPHPFGKADDPLFFTRVLVSPEGDRLTADFAKALITAEGLGTDDVPDYLSVSFSGVDAVNHFFGPSSLENEEVVLELDRTLADFLAFVDKTVGLDNTLIVLSADHGMPEAPEVLAEKGMNVGRLDPEKVVEVAKDVAKQEFGLEGAVRAFFRPYLYLDSKAISAKGLDQEKVEQVLAAALQRVSGIGKAVSMRALPKLSGTPVLDMIRKNHHPLRSGDIYVAQAPYWFLQEGGALAVMHGSPWRYDTHVPIIFAGAGITGQTVHRHVRPVDVAPTIAKLLGIKEPSSASGTVLVEVLQ